ncbi:MAG: hypothetical protein KC503_03235 [Myxococcales bacterium]|nr:hypothetical protein [Myxococcales bacterium]
MKTRHALIALASLLLFAACGGIEPNGTQPAAASSGKADQTDQTDPTDNTDQTQPASGVEVKDQLVHSSEHQVSIKLDRSTVLCSAADYGATFLKVLIPQLAALTLLDHQNTGAGAPCVAAGMCALLPDGPGLSPEQVLDDKKLTEDVTIAVRASRANRIDHDAKTCATTLVEQVKVNIRGLDFFHERRAPLGERPYSDCLL